MGGGGGFRVRRAPGVGGGGARDVGGVVGGLYPRGRTRERATREPWPRGRRGEEDDAGCGARRARPGGRARGPHRAGVRGAFTHL